ncbi:unnamed protein product [Acanthocheilonema viteae]|uniref:CCHC-type domain-containing protein n=1 Tax=Acanthocheilonema viteae TaxID=6277 RepID=A0A498SZ32_ACAVI|nr:unnamed protein product [Acanthocheilonema viteae]
MSSIIIRTADQTKRKLCDVLDDIKRLNLDSNNQMTTTEETIQSSSGAEKNHPRKNHAYPNLYRSVGSSQYRAVERTLRQLEAIGENLEQSGIEIAVERRQIINLDSRTALTTAVPEKPTIKALSRSCALCNKNHWDEECQTYPTLKQRLERLKKFNACFNCFKAGHITAKCKNKKRNCFHCTSQHNSALCSSRFKEVVNKLEGPDSIITINTIVEKG